MHRCRFVITPNPPSLPRFEAERAWMVEEQLRAAGVYDERVLEAMRAVPRELFVPQHLRAASYADQPLPIGHGQTISQPLMVALMLQALELGGRERVLDVGTGSGYQAALLGRLSEEVWSIEIVPELAQRARDALLGAGARNVFVVIGDGSNGLTERAPFDAIVVAAASPRVPRALTDQLAPGGRLVLPIGYQGDLQTLVRIRMSETGRRLTSENLGRCAFVPLVGTGAALPSRS